MAAEWFYQCKGEKHGPVSAAELKRLAEAGRLLATDLVWKKAMAAPVPAAKVKGLFPEEGESRSENIRTNPELAERYFATFRQGVAHLDARDYDRAIAEFTQAIQLDPTPGQPYFTPPI